VAAGATLNEVLTGTVPDPDKPVLRDGTLQQNGAGGLVGANVDFDRMQPSNVTNHGKGVRTGTLYDGTHLVVRPLSVPTLEITVPNGRTYIIRYK
jgi:hypothetical protein